jgi:hypothetical protein
MKKIELTYTERDGIFYPDLELSEQPEVHLNKYGRLRLKYLKNHKRVIYMNYITSCTLNQHLIDIQNECDEMHERLVKQLAKAQGVTEELKANDQMAWVGKMNNIYHQADEFILNDIIYA